MAVGMLVCVGSAVTINQTKYDQQIDLQTNMTGYGSSYVNYTFDDATTPYHGVTKVAWQTIEFNETDGRDLRLANQYIYDHTNVSGNNNSMTAGSLQWLDLETSYNESAKPVNQTLITNIGIYLNSFQIPPYNLKSTSTVSFSMSLNPNISSVLLDVPVKFRYQIFTWCPNLT